MTHETPKVALPVMSDEVSNLIGLLGDLAGVYGNYNLARVPLPENNVGGAALTAMSLISMDLRLGGKYGIAKTAEKHFGNLDNAFSNLGLIACATLGGGSLIRLANEGQLGNLANPLWIKVAANLGPYLVATGMDTEESKPMLDSIIKQHVGDQMIFTVPTQDGCRTFKSVDSIRISQQASIFAGAAMMWGFALARNDAFTQQDVHHISIPQVASSLLNIMSQGRTLSPNEIMALTGLKSTQEASNPSVLTEAGMATELPRRQVFGALLQAGREVRDTVRGYFNDPAILVENLGVLAGKPNQSLIDAGKKGSSQAR